MQTNEPESIWAEGVPQNINDEMVLKIPELLLLGVDFIVRQYAMKHGFKIEQATADIRVLPNIILRKDDVLYAIAVVPSVYPRYGYLLNEARLNMVKVAKQYGAKPYYTSVAFKSTDEERAKAGLALKGDVFTIFFRGFVLLTEEENQNLVVDNSEYVFI